MPLINRPPLMTADGKLKSFFQFRFHNHPGQVAARKMS